MRTSARLDTDPFRCISPWCPFIFLGLSVHVWTWGSAGKHVKGQFPFESAADTIESCCSGLPSRENPPKMGSWLAASGCICKVALGQWPGTAVVEEITLSGVCTRLPCWAAQALLRHCDQKLFLAHLFSFPILFTSGRPYGLKTLPAHSCFISHSC